MTNPDTVEYTFQELNIDILHELQNAKAVYEEYNILSPEEHEAMQIVTRDFIERYS